MKKTFELCKSIEYPELRTDLALYAFGCASLLFGQHTDLWFGKSVEMNTIRLKRSHQRKDTGASPSSGQLLMGCLVAMTHILRQKRVEIMNGNSSQKAEIKDFIKKQKNNANQIQIENFCDFFGLIVFDLFDSFFF